MAEKQSDDKPQRQQVKSKERVANHGEVFTAEREVNAMLDLVKQETERIDSRFLEPACGDGNFLAEILRRKLSVVYSRYHKNLLDYEKNSLLAVSSIYGIEIQMDNVITCRERLYKIWDKAYSQVLKNDADEKTRNAIKFILKRNVVCGNALTLMQVDENGNEKTLPIVFSEWAFISGSMLQRKDYTFNELVNAAPLLSEAEESQGQMTLDFGGTESPDPEGKLLQQYTTHYKEVQNYE